MFVGTAVAASLALNNVLKGDTAPPPSEELVAQLKFSDVTDESVKRQIAQLHDGYNDMLGWGNYKQFTHEKTRAEAWEMYRNTGNMADNAAFQGLVENVTNEAVKQDLLTVYKLIDIAVYHEDVEALFYIHRILHDLDYWVFNDTENAEYFGASLALDGELAQKIHWFVEHYDDR